MNYPTGDFLIRIKNAYAARKKELSFPRTKTAFAIAKILEEEGYVKKVKEVVDDGKKNITIELLYAGRKPALQGISLVSKPSVHEYSDLKKIRHESRYGITIITTNKGIMTAAKAQKAGAGGEIICRVY